MTTTNRSRYVANLRAEVDSASLYDVLAGAEADPAISAVYRRLAATERAHADVWEKLLRDAGEPVPPRTPSCRRPCPPSPKC